ncbi:DUF2459 domain-containing protein [Gluconacetobacter takamatsuzukensis]|uniref:DUF2459 domain-containing protein n=1 Tax=Gluconacetobacter takamatsuzukensis TaxID=1286190 RepID=A0A7W4KE32_9PROT|nr:DUF2459 domain-containing protein [Gluconacetobacter takamatsuzukensis]MBB2205273.1 DUF2459 domain-containing protein [Gluconacetobacter takamatsuzukensis]
MTGGWLPLSRLPRLALLPALGVLLACCADGHRPPACPAGDMPGDRTMIYLVDRGWHTEIGVPVAALSGKLAIYRAIFPGAQTVLFGYGKKTFFTAPASSVEEYLIGPFPGPAVVQVFAMTTTPDRAYDPDDVVVLPMCHEEAERLSAFIGDDLEMGRDGRPRLVAVGHGPESLFYAARSRYTLFHTCNGWVAQALGQAGLPVSDGGVVFAGQVMARGARAAGRLCRPPAP